MHPRYEQGRMPSNVVGATRTAAEAALCQGSCPLLRPHLMLSSHDPSRFHASRQWATPSPISTQLFQPLLQPLAATLPDPG